MSCGLWGIGLIGGGALRYQMDPHWSGRSECQTLGLVSLMDTIKRCGGCSQLET